MKSVLITLIIFLQGGIVSAQNNRIGIGFNNLRVGFSREEVDTNITRNFNGIVTLQPYIHYTKLLPKSNYFSLQLGFSKIYSNNLDQVANLAGKPDTSGVTTASNNTFLGFIFGKAYMIDKFVIQPSLKAHLNFITNSTESRFRRYYDQASGSILEYSTRQDIRLPITAELGLFFAQGVEYNLSKKIKIGSFLNIGLRFSKYFGTKSTITETYIQNPLEFNSFTRNQQYSSYYNITTGIYPSFQLSYAF
jgi:hypothetical protein